MNRETLLKNWSMQQLGLSQANWSMVSGDASFRRYFRLQDSKQSWICVDAPPEHENSEQFIKVASMLNKVNAPKVLVSDLEQGFMLLTDLGDRLYLPLLNDESADNLYKKAIDSLIEMQRIESADLLPAYDEKLLNIEMELFRDWFLKEHLQLKLSADENLMLDQLFKWLTDSALEQPQVFVHRDYHSRNIMQIDGQSPGIIDFQDAVHGAITYDLLSLLRDCYIEWPAHRVNDWVNYFVEQSDWELDKAQLEQWFDWMGLQRHIKVAGIFARLNYRDGKPGYLKDLPLTLKYIVYQAKKYPQLDEFSQWVQQKVLPKMDSLAQIQ
ncbi:aminoglycoside phosphotransferase family protein [Kangiella sp. HZ709]|uniref:aminoglycoside phosphotransferase family protein n=1 Tax=Kangiella sp. HZ709 TaxID=2666328 RepID=UPI0012B0E828|nr:phosphotransferase [Kangiella sp. HZ709]MRX27613.1 phosphotransferase [Kangiella sp. HZ709]